MISFESDYIEGCHPQILEQLTKTNLEQLSGYGNDKYSDRAKEKIAAACKCPGAQVHFICGGTQTNQLVIDALLQKYEGVVAVTTGHVSVHEAGAIEFTGHKVLTVPAHEGKMDSRELSAYLKTFYGDGNHEHMVQPGMVYISQSRLVLMSLYSMLPSLLLLTAMSEYGIRQTTIQTSYSQH